MEKHRFRIATLDLNRFALAASVVLALYDSSDVFLEVGKMSKSNGAKALSAFRNVKMIVECLADELINVAKGLSNR
ncbi:hypothetical protein L6452_39046 [Arctium lappa]|uniref:Uncharacterized protein n=1 Tax=Arctium lappa TaxID=4217 RepID=A0ACB8XRN3_ARCLA|nr:hypothetical protein L6452_39046 [Arctium lappa]